MKKSIFIFGLAVFILLIVSHFYENRAFAEEGYLGVYVQELSEPMKKALGIEYGVLVTETAEDSPARKEGIKEGDVLLEIDGKKIGDYDILKDVVAENANKKVKINILSGGKTKSVSVKIGERKDSRYKYKWEWEYSPRFHGDKIIPPFGMYPFGREEIEKLKKQMEELQRNLKQLYKDLGKEYKEYKEDKDKKMREPEKEQRDFERFHRGFLPFQDI